MNRFSVGRFLAVLRKESIQVRRDPMTLRLIIALPIMQLFLFGYAINTDPKHLPTGLLAADHSPYERAIVAALRNTGYYNIVAGVAKRGDDQCVHISNAPRKGSSHREVFGVGVDRVAEQKELHHRQGDNEAQGYRDRASFAATPCAEERRTA